MTSRKYPKKAPMFPKENRDAVSGRIRYIYSIYIIPSIKIQRFYNPHIP